MTPDLRWLLLRDTMLWIFLGIAIVVGLLVAERASADEPPRCAIMLLKPKVQYAFPPRIYSIQVDRGFGYVYDQNTPHFEPLRPGGPVGYFKLCAESGERFRYQVKAWGWPPGGSWNDRQETEWSEPSEWVEFP